MSEPSAPGEPAFEAVEKRHNPWMTGLAAIPLALIPVLLVAAAITKPFVAVFCFHATVIGLGALGYVRRRKPFARRVPVEVRVEPDACLVDEARIPRSEIQRGDRDGRGVTLRCQRLREVELEMGSEEDARDLLGALELDATQTTATYRGMSRTQASTVRAVATTFGMLLGSMVLSGVLGALHPAAGGLGVLIGIAVMLALVFAPTRIEVGGDGVLTRWLGRERFVPYSEIVSAYSAIEGMGRGKRAVVVVHLEAGEIWKLPIGTPGWGGEARADAIATRIEDARQAYERGAVMPESLRRPPDASFGAWVRRLRAGERVGHREAVVPRERLWRVVEDAAGDPVERAAATVALGPALTPDERARLARVVKRTAAPKLRVVLESAAGAEERELAQHLEELDRDRQAPANKA